MAQDDKTASGRSSGGLLGWLDERIPLTKLWNEHLAQYYAPKNFNFWYYFGALSLLILVMQLLSGIWLTMHYKPTAAEAFASVEYIMREVPYGDILRYLHSTGASFFFIVVYLHMFRALMYGSFKSPRELVWLVGMGIFLCLMAEAFFGYLLPWGQMSFWGAQVIISLFGAIPFVGEPLSLWIRGDYVVSDATLNRFFSLHVAALPMVLFGLVGAHIVALHEVGSNNPDGVEIKKYKNAAGIPRDGIPFHPYYTVKDLMGAAAFLFIFCLVVFFFPEFNGWFLEKDNFVPADPLKTPEHIMPVWYFTPYYAILRAVPDKLLGVLSMGAAVMIFAAMPWLDRHPIKSIRYRSKFYRWLLGAFVATFLILGYLGTQPAQPHLSELGFRLGEIYFLFFFMLLVYSRPRSREFMLTTLAIIVLALLVLDALRFSPDRIGLMFRSALIPIVYLAIFVLGPVRKPELHQDKPVPEHVT